MCLRVPTWMCVVPKGVWYRPPAASDALARKGCSRWGLIGGRPSSHPQTDDQAPYIVNCERTVSKAEVAGPVGQQCTAVAVVFCCALGWRSRRAESYDRLVLFTDGGGCGSRVGGSATPNAGDTGVLLGGHPTHRSSMRGLASPGSEAQRAYPVFAQK